MPSKIIIKYLVVLHVMLRLDCAIGEIVQKSNLDLLYGRGLMMAQ
jgi:hypothetical protein